jgi:hypothetical protein
MWIAHRRLTSAAQVGTQSPLSRGSSRCDNEQSANDQSGELAADLRGTGRKEATKPRLEVGSRAPVRDGPSTANIVNRGLQRAFRRNDQGVLRADLEYDV